MEPTVRKLLCLFAVTAIVATGCNQANPALKPVRGKVLINGKPAERVAVTLINVDPSAKGNAAHPRAATDANGEFLLSTDSDADGAVAGEYMVGLVWWSDPDPDKAKDLLGGVFADPKLTNLRVKITAEGANELKPFELTADEKQAALFVH